MVDLSIAFCMFTTGYSINLVYLSRETTNFLRSSRGLYKKGTSNGHCMMATFLDQNRFRYKPLQRRKLRFKYNPIKLIFGFEKTSTFMAAISKTHWKIHEKIPWKIHGNPGQIPWFCHLHRGPSRSWHASRRRSKRCRLKESSVGSARVSLKMADIEHVYIYTYIYV